MTTTDHAAETTLSYCVKHSRQRPPWNGPIPWEQPVPEIGGVIGIEGESYRVLDVGVTDPGPGWPERHISVYVQRQEART